MQGGKREEEKQKKGVGGGGGGRGSVEGGGDKGTHEQGEEGVSNKSRSSVGEDSQMSHQGTLSAKSKNVSMSLSPQTERRLFTLC